jgi:hypothetical protein
LREKKPSIALTNTIPPVNTVPLDVSGPERSAKLPEEEIPGNPEIAHFDINLLRRIKFAESTEIVKKQKKQIVGIEDIPDPLPA